MGTTLPPNRRLLYGTAWKKDETADLVFKAIQAGFTAVDTACQPRHYREDLVGEGIRKAFAEGVLKHRSDIWIQTKFTRPTGQDPETAPYDMNASVEEQVHTSIKTSLKHLRHYADLDASSDESVYLDSLVLHSPFPDFKDTLTAWHTMSTYVPHRVRAIGISNIPHALLLDLYDAVDIKPSCVQVRFQPETNWEIPTRRFCATRGIIFQAHRVLKKKEDMLDSELIREVSAALRVSRHVAMYLCVLGLGEYMSILGGPKSEGHMKEDIEGLEQFEKWSVEEQNRTVWDGYMTRFKAMIGEE
ncbi:NAD(P)H-dependent D-xylose reductase [Cytospora mali]|uniref:NAD(P)H-dependent D-xylose reductase n=1 Tax=Cytospora mali TaxID=578113 RepID=A0A194V1L3_CYTMA|nr:NAD(P)H-dependent D-xylose reductase [Valsa mali var. pyri (nom. inval.)]